MPIRKAVKNEEEVLFVFKKIIAWKILFFIYSSRKNIYIQKKKKKKKKKKGTRVECGLQLSNIS